MAETTAPQNRQQAEREIREAFGFVPEFYQAMPDAGMASAWALQRDMELADTALDHKTKELIGLSMAAHIKCRYCIHFHTRAAAAFGATEQEMREAILMGGLTVTYSNNLTGTQQDLDRFRADVDRAIDFMTQKAQGSQRP